MHTIVSEIFTSGEYLSILGHIRVRGNCNRLAGRRELTVMRFVSNRSIQGCTTA